MITHAYVRGVKGCSGGGVGHMCICGGRAAASQEMGDEPVDPRLSRFSTPKLTSLWSTSGTSGNTSLSSVSCSLLGSSGQGINDVSDTQTTTTSENLPSTDSDSDSELGATGHVPETLYRHEQPP